MENEQNNSLSTLLKRAKRKKIIFNSIYIPIVVIVLLISVIGTNEPEGFPLFLGICLFLTLVLWILMILVLSVIALIDFMNYDSTEKIIKTLNDEELQIYKEVTKLNKWDIEYWSQKRKEKLNKNNSKSQKPKGNKTFWIIGFIVLLGLVAGIMDDNDYSSPQTQPTTQPSKTETKKEQPKQNKEDLTWFAQYACEKEIKARAVYPPSVKVHFRRDNYIKGNSYTVYGTVDWQNGYGAMIRQNFACEAIIDKENDKYWVNDLNIE